MSCQGRPNLAVLACIVLLAAAAPAAGQVSRFANEEDLPIQATPIQDDANLHDVQFVGSKIGWAVGDHGVVWHSKDGGQTWQIVKTPVDCSLRSVCFLTDRVGWIAGGGVTPFTRIGFSVVLFTKDGGQTWQRLAKDRLPQLHFVKFFGMKDGVVVGEATSDHPTGVFVTHDAGVTWHDVGGERVAGWRTADFLSMDSGAVAGMQGNVALVGGSNLIQQRVGDLGLRGLRDVALQRDQTGWLVGDGGLVLRTINGGVVWQSPPSPLPNELRHVTDFRAVACRGHRVWVAGQPGAVIWHSSDSGSTWTKQFTRQTQPIDSIWFSSDTNGWAVGAMGLILATQDGGQTWHAARGGNRRVALLTLHARPSQVSLRLLAKFSGEFGYRSAVALLPRRDVGPNGHSETDLDLRLQQAVATVGGSTGEIDWRLPLTVPGLERHPTKLIAAWNRQTDGRLRDVLLGKLVAQLRTWRPSVLVIDQPADDDATTKLLNDAILHAVKQAADPTRFIEQRELAGLIPWQVKKVYLHLPAGSTGNAHVDPNELLPRTGQTVEMASATAYATLMPPVKRLVQREAYRLVQDHGKGIQLVSAGDIFTGVALAPGSNARRKLTVLNATDFERQRRIAQRQRNFRAYTERFLSQPNRASALIAELNGIVQGMPDQQAALQLAQLTAEYRRVSRWDLVEATLVELVERYPEEPVTVDGMRWLFQCWSSAEVAWQRSRKTHSGRQRVTSNRQQVAERLRAAIERAKRDSDEQQFAALGNQSDPLNSALHAVRLNRGGQDLWRNKTVRSWHQRAVQMAKLIKQKSPSLFESPQIEFPLAALLRQRAAYDLADRYYRGYQRAGRGDPWKRAALAESWLSQPVNLPPKEFILCRATAARPILDGVLSDECWRQAVELPLRQSESAELPGIAYPFVLLSYDAEFLYLAASIPRIPGTPQDGPLYEGRSHDADLANFDRLGLFLDIDRDYSTYYKIEVDQRGWLAESCWGDHSWNPKCFVAVDGDEKHWRVELAIPISELAPTTPARQVWSVGIVRTIPTIGLQSWTHPASTVPRPESFGLVKFD